MAHTVARPTEEGSRILAVWNQQRQSAGRRAMVMRSPRGALGRTFAAADHSRLTSSFDGDYVSMNQNLEYSLRILVGRSRQLAKNNDYVRKFLRMCMNNIVGPDGFRLHVPCKGSDGKLDKRDSQVVELSFKGWTKKGVCDVTRKLTFRALCRLLVLHAARDGEFIVRKVQGKDRGPFGFQLQVIDPVLLDHNYRADLGNGNKIRMGVEFDAWGAPVAYHLLSDVEYGMSQTRVRVPASEIWHEFLAEEPSQVRGVPWIISAMRRLNDMGGYEQAAVIAARIGASKMGFYTEDAAASSSPITTAELADDVAEDGELLTDADPGTFHKLPPGVGFESFNPDYPHQNYDAFIKACLRGIASGIGADYNTLGNDLENVNFSSIRHGMLETREEWMNLQNWFKEGFLEPLSPVWLDAAFLSSQLPGLPISKYEKYNCFEWQGRRWPWVDPLKDVEAKVAEINGGLNSFSAVIREAGRDPDTVWTELEADLPRVTKLLNAIGKGAAPKPPTPEPQAEPEGAKP